MSVLSNLAAFVGMFAVIYIPIKSFNIIYRTQDLNSFDFKKRYLTIIAGLKVSSPLWYQFICIFYFRRAVYASIFVLFQSQPVLQIIFADFVTASMLVYLIIIRPYNSLLSTLLSIVNEILVIWMITPTYRFLEEEITPNLSKMIGSIFVGIVVGTIVVNWFSIIVYGTTIYIKK